MTAALAEAAADRIAELLLAGHTVDLACERGLAGGWTRADVLELVAERGWQLDGSGRIPLRDRPRTAPPARRRGDRRPAVGVVRAPVLPPQLEAIADWAHGSPVTQTPTREGTAAAPIATAAAGTAPEPPPVTGRRAPDAAPQVSPSRSQPREGGERGASDAPAGLTAAGDLLAEGLAHTDPAVQAAAADVQAAIERLWAELTAVGVHG